VTALTHNLDLLLECSSNPRRVGSSAATDDGVRVV
jgi:hypothetical protein